MSPTSVGDIDVYTVPPRAFESRECGHPHPGNTAEYRGPPARVKTLDVGTNSDRPSMGLLLRPADGFDPPPWADPLSHGPGGRGHLFDRHCEGEESTLSPAQFTVTATEFPPRNNRIDFVTQTLRSTTRSPSPCLNGRGAKQPKPIGG